VTSSRKRVCQTRKSCDGGIQSFAREYQVTSPMLRFASESDAEGKRADIARTHDDALVKSYRVLPSMKRR
jgi:hypothetical protein